MGFHTYPVDRADPLEDAAARYRYLSAEELLWLLDIPADAAVADLGSGTGFYTDDVASAIGPSCAPGGRAGPRATAPHRRTGRGGDSNDIDDTVRLTKDPRVQAKNDGAAVQTVTRRARSNGASTASRATLVARLRRLWCKTTAATIPNGQNRRQTPPAGRPVPG